MDNPEYEIMSESDDSLIHMNRIVPVYRVTSGLSVRQMRSIMFHTVQSYIKDVADTIPVEILKRNALARIALKASHRSTSLMRILIWTF